MSTYGKFFKCNLKYENERLHTGNTPNYELKTAYVSSI